MLLFILRFSLRAQTQRIIRPFSLTLFCGSSWIGTGTQSDCLSLCPSSRQALCPTELVAPKLALTLRTLLMGWRAAGSQWRPFLKRAQRSLRTFLYNNSNSSSSSSSNSSNPPVTVRRAQNTATLSTSSHQHKSRTLPRSLPRRRTAHGPPQTRRTSSPLRSARTRMSITTAAPARWTVTSWAPATAATRCVTPTAARCLWLTASTRTASPAAGAPKHTRGRRRRGTRRRRTPAQTASSMRTARAKLTPSTCTSKQSHTLMRTDLEKDRNVKSL